MPFKSKAQMRLCYGVEIVSFHGRKRPVKWDCDKWLAETPVLAECLPERKSQPPPCQKRRRPGQKISRSGLIRGPRGGVYEIIEGVKVYAKRPRNKV